LEPPGLGSRRHRVHGPHPAADGPGDDDALQRSLEKQGLKFRLNTGAQRATIKGNRVALTWKSGDDTQVEEADPVLVAIGRRPYTESLGLREIGVNLDQRGFVTVNSHFETNVPGLYAIGDVIGGAMLAHKAERKASPVPS
jgi:dihydrolipoamide dehydrogenase